MSGLTQPIQPADPKPGQAILVTFKNYKWAAEILGENEETLLKEVQACNREDEICVRSVPR